MGNLGETKLPLIMQISSIVADYLLSGKEFDWIAI